MSDFKGCLQVYTGTGKGKTTAALGLALRASGAGLKIYIGQFIKKGDYSEIRALKNFRGAITVRQYGIGCFVKGRPSKQDIQAARSGMSELRSAMLSGQYDIIIADELNPAVRCGLIDIEDLLRLTEDRPICVELVITGRDAHPRLKRQADLVTDMRCSKHYYDRGIKARKGIEY